MILVEQIRMPITEKVETAKEKAIRKLGISPKMVSSTHLWKVALDARRGKVNWVCSVAINAGGWEGEIVAKANHPTVRLIQEEVYHIPQCDPGQKAPPVIVGFGPAGLFAALVLAKAGLCPIVIERGGSVEERTAAVSRFWQDGELVEDCNVQFGEGGAGTFSDGKLTTRIGDSRCRFILEELVAHGAPEEIRYQAKPHVGTDRLRDVVRAMRGEIIRLGGQVFFHAKCSGISGLDKGVSGVTAGENFFATEHVVLAVGHSARDMFAYLAENGVPMEAKSFSVGVRIEHLQQEVDQSLYGSMAGHPHLKQGEYQLSHRRRDGRAVYTFCMCPGGFVVPSSSEAGGVVTNGMSHHARNERNANSALVVSVTPMDYGRGVLDGVVFQRELERAAFVAGQGNYAAPAQTVGAFLEGRKGLDLKRVCPSYMLGVKPADFHQLLPPIVTEMMAEGLARFDQKQKGFASPDSVLTGLETRTSSPVRILRGENLQAVGITGLYPTGEGAGYAGGIMSAAVDGMRVAEAVISAYCNPDKSLL